MTLRELIEALKALEVSSPELSVVLATDDCSVWEVQGVTRERGIVFIDIIISREDG